MTPDVAKRVIEGALLCANRPLAINDIRQLFDEESEVSSDTVQALLDELRQDWQGRSVELVPLASGSDTGGSLRNQAAFNGIVGFRPTPGLVPNEKKPLGWAALGVLGPMARTVTDLAPGTQYYWALYARNAVGYSSRSGIRPSQTLAAARVPKAGLYVPAAQVQAPKGGVLVAAQVKAPKNGVYVSTI